MKNNFDFEVRNDLTLCNDVLESLFVEIDGKYFGMNRNTLIGIVYRPPGQSMSLFNEQLSSILSTLRKENKGLYIMGDYNINIMNSDTHTCTSEFLEIMYSHCLIPLINKPTRVTDNRNHY